MCVCTYVCMDGCMDGWVDVYMQAVLLILPGQNIQDSEVPHARTRRFNRSGILARLAQKRVSFAGLARISSRFALSRSSQIQ